MQKRDLFCYEREMAVQFYSVYTGVSYFLLI